MARNPLKFDPTRTSALRRRFIAAARARFNRLRRAVIQLVGVEDAFGLDRKFPISPVNLAEAIGPPQASFVGNERFAFLTDDRKIDAFNRWLREQVKQGILEAEGDENPDEPWTAEFMNSAYRQGILRAYAETHKVASLEDEDEDDDGGGAFYRGGREQFLQDAFGAGQSVARMRMLATRAYEDLKGITAAMSTQIGRELALGFAEGRGAMDMARALADRVEKIGRTRAEALARTEVVRAYNEAQLDAFERLGVEEVGVMAEIATAGDSKVCPLCAPLEGVVVKVSEARGMLPRHVACRCAFKPANVGEPTKGQKRTKEAIERAIDKSVRAERPKAEPDEARDKTTWAGADKDIAKKRDPGTGTTPSPTKDRRGGGGDDGGGTTTTTTTSTTATPTTHDFFPHFTTPTPTTATPTTPMPKPTTTTTTSRAAREEKSVGQRLRDESLQRRKELRQRIEELKKQRSSAKKTKDFIRIGEEIEELEKEVTKELRRTIQEQTTQNAALEDVRQAVLREATITEQDTLRETEAAQNRYVKALQDKIAAERALQDSMSDAKKLRKAREAYEKASDLAERERLEFERLSQRQSVEARAREALAVQERTRMNTTNTELTSPVEKQRIQIAEKFISSVTPKDQLEEVKLSYKKVQPGTGTVVSVADRAHYRDSDRTVNLEPNQDARVIVHEIAHHIEYNAPGVQQAAQEFVKMRIERGGKPTVKLKEEFPDYKYADHEEGNADDFEKLWGAGNSRAYYAGKTYQDGATEIVSLGVEEMYRDPVGFAEKDPEYFKFILGVLRGDIK